MNSIRLVLVLSALAVLAGCVAVPAQRVVYQQAPAGTVQPAPPVVYVPAPPMYYYPAPYYYYPAPSFYFRWGGGGHRGHWR